MLVYEDSCHEESAPQVRAMERAFKKSSEGQRLNKLVCQRALAITERTMPKIGITARTTAKTGNGIGTKELSETQGVVAETLLLQIVAATPERKRTITRSARGIRGTRRTVKAQGKGAATFLLIQGGIDQATVSALKLMMIIPMRVFRCCAGG
jgi:hypothetical protein